MADNFKAAPSSEFDLFNNKFINIYFSFYIFSSDVLLPSSNRGSANLELELFRAALKDAQASLSTLPNYLPAHILKGRIEERQGNYLFF